MQIRGVGKSDLDKLAELHCDSWIQAYKHLFPIEKLKEISVNYFRNIWEQNLSFSDCTHLLAEEKDLPFGFISFDNIEIHSLYISPSRIGLGIGTALLKSAFFEIGNRGTEKVIGWVVKDNSSAISFYEKWGFKYTNKERTINRHGIEFTQKRYCIDLLKHITTKCNTEN